MAEPLPSAGPASHLLQSAVRLAGSLLGAVQTRGELLTTELEQEIGRGARILLLGFTTLLAAILGLLVLGFLIVIVFWDTHRVGAAIFVLLAFVATAAGCGWALRNEIKGRPRFLAATREELARDVTRLRSGR
jgi:uncharacterized membrane protein YqjE